ncbi:hypothetical protein BDZ89DRAFT_1130554 [Hymenopellis radicata]|nr:hypothetical protein BDZ89DRAFT_1130554 [Hymenopellis radicata]
MPFLMALNALTFLSSWCLYNNDKSGVLDGAVVTAAGLAFCRFKSLHAIVFVTLPHRETPSALSGLDAADNHHAPAQLYPSSVPPQ